MPEIERDLEDCRALASEPISGINLRVLLRRSKRPSVAIPVLLVLLALVSLGVWGLQRASKIRWARTQALPQIAQLIDLSQGLRGNGRFTPGYYRTPPWG